MEIPNELMGYVCQNGDKMKRAIEGTPGKEGKLEGGVGEGASQVQKLAEYDRLGGFITKDGYKVKTGSFYDFDKKQLRNEPNVILIFRDLDGRTVELTEAEVVSRGLPPEVKAAESIKSRQASRKVRKTRPLRK